MTKRKGISKKIRFEIFKRDGFSCQYCGDHPPAVILEIDHINPVANGGDNDTDNLITACNFCNRGKSANLLTSVPQSLKEKSEIIAEQEEQIRGYSQILQAKKDRIEDDTWKVAELFTARRPDKNIREDHFLTIRRFVDKLGTIETYEAMEIAMAKFPYASSRTIKYFCGVCWRKIKEAEDARSQP